MLTGCSSRRDAASRVSVRARAANRQRAPNPVRTQNSSRQDPSSINWPPTSGASMGATAPTICISERTCAPSSRSKQSRTMAEPSTGRAQPPSA